MGEVDRDLARRIRRLQDKRRVRDAHGLFYVESVAPFLQACAAGLELEAIVWSPVLLRSSAAQKLVRLQRRAGVRTVRVSPEAFRRLSCMARASGIAAIGRQRWRPLRAIDPALGLCWLVLERVRSPGNLGTILRTAEAVGAAGLILVGPADPYAPTAIRGSMGAVFHLDKVRTDLASFSAWAERNGVQRLGTSPAGSELYSEVELRPPVALLLGDERCGLSDAALAACDLRVHLPIRGRGDSLNVAVAGGVVLYDLLRRL